MHYLSDEIPGNITTNPPGHFVVAIGRALSETTLDIEVHASIATAARLLNSPDTHVLICQPVYSTSSGTKLARANSASYVGLVKDLVISANAEGDIQTDGNFVAPTNKWDAVTGDSGGLTPGATYYLSPDTVGKITSAVPTTVGDYIVVIGTALSSTKMKLVHEQTILL